MRAVFVAALLVGACVLVLAEDTLTAVPAYAKAKHKLDDDSKDDSSYDTTTEYVVKGDKHNKHSMIVAKDGKDGKDGRDGRDGAPGRDGRDGRDAWVTTAWRNGNLDKVNISSSTSSDDFSGDNNGNAKHVVGQLKSTAVCESGEKAISCSCDTQMSSSAGKGFIAPTTTDYEKTGEGWLERVNYITLVGNALSASPQAYSGSKDTCTCTAMYVATVRSSRGGGSSGNDDSWSEDDDSNNSDDSGSGSHHGSGSGSHHGSGSGSHKKHSSKVVYGDDVKIAAADKDSSSAAVTGKDTTAAKPAYYYEDWTKKAPKWQAFELTATVTCQTAKLVPRPHHKDEYDYNTYGGGSDDYTHKSDNKYDYSKSDKYENKKYEKKETYGDGNSVKYDNGKDSYKSPADKDDYFSEDKKSYNNKHTQKHNTNKKDY